MSIKVRRRACSTPRRVRSPRQRSTASAAEGYRVLGVAWRKVDADRQHANVVDEVDLTFAGFLAFLDPPKAGAREALTAPANMGIALKVVTGDNEYVTRHVCGELGLKVAEMLTGAEVARLTDEALLARVDCGFRRKSATHSDLKPATDSDLKSATCSDPSRPPIPI